MWRQRRDKEGRKARDVCGRERGSGKSHKSQNFTPQNGGIVTTAEDNDGDNISVL
jgi:hypothetical protein